ncbi:MAG: hypothetical protein CVU87_05575 [Firmicutes bacterium HGW-Firmicutes-12]|jgi:uncharacterized protein|nr:MAG: hypothetical protein CVU87_05575 [Firmicutes bacterium HGW-Firmicutes-12]
MKINVSRLRKEAGSIEEFQFIIPQLQDMNGVLINKPISVRGRLSNIGEALQLIAQVETGLSVRCDRCLEEVLVPLEFEFIENYCHESDSDEETIENNEYIVFEDDLIDMVQAVRENIILNLPMRVLCAPDCPGICSQCGQNLKEKKCNCSSDTVDPRLAVLAKLKQL